MVVTTGDGRRPSMRSTCLVPSIPMRDTISLEKIKKNSNKLLKIVPFIYYNTHDARFNQNLQMESIFLVFNFLNVSHRRDRCCVLCRQEKWAAEVCVCGRGVTIQSRLQSAILHHKCSPPLIIISITSLCCVISRNSYYVHKNGTRGAPIQKSRHARSQDVQKEKTNGRKTERKKKQKTKSRRNILDISPASKIKKQHKLTKHNRNGCIHALRVCVVAAGIFKRHRQIQQNKNIQPTRRSTTTCVCF